MVYSKFITIDKEVIKNENHTQAKGRSLTCGTTERYDIHFYSLNEQQATLLYEFAASNTNVEWGKTVIKTNNANKYIVTTSHHANNEAGISYMSENINTPAMELPFSGEIVELSHSHSKGNHTLSKGDVAGAKLLYKRFPDATLTIYDQINYIPYNHNSLPGYLDEIVVTPKAK